MSLSALGCGITFIRGWRAEVFFFLSRTEWVVHLLLRSLGIHCGAYLLQDASGNGQTKVCPMIRDAVADEGSGLETGTSPDSFFLKFKSIRK